MVHLYMWQPSLVPLPNLSPHCDPVSPSYLPKLISLFSVVFGQLTSACLSPVGFGAASPRGVVLALRGRFLGGLGVCSSGRVAASQSGLPFAPACSFAMRKPIACVERCRNCAAAC